MATKQTNQPLAKPRRGPAIRITKGPIDESFDWDVVRESDQENDKAGFMTVVVQDRTKTAAVAGAMANLSSELLTGEHGGHRFYVYLKHSLLETVTGVPISDRAEMLKRIRAGLPFKAIPALEDAYSAPRKDMAEWLSISTSTLNRRKGVGKLHTDESDRVARFARIHDAAVEMMQGDTEAANAWLRTPMDVLGNEKPIDHAVTEMGADDVLDLIGRIRHGVFS